MYSRANALITKDGSGYVLLTWYTDTELVLRFRGFINDMQIRSKGNC